MGCFFEKISSYKNIDFPMPERKTANSAAYDFCAVEDIKIPSIFNLIFSVLLERLSNTEFSTKATSFLTNLSENDDFIKAIADKDEGEIEKVLKDSLEIFKGDMTVTLPEMKEIVSKAKAKLNLIPTGIKCKLDPDQVLHLYIRSSCPLNHYLMLANGTGVIDSDYYNNKDNEGHIYFQIINFSPFDIVIKKGDIIGQGEITRYCIVDNDKATGVRVGGFGSTSK